MDLFGPWGDFKIVISELAVEVVQVPRSWRERLFTRPWRPWARLKRAERPAVYMVDQGAPANLRGANGIVGVGFGPGKVILVHPALWLWLQGEMGRGDDGP